MADVRDLERRFPTLSAELWKQLEAVEPSRDGTLLYRPCQVEVSDGRIVDHVYMVDARTYIQIWGVWPELDSGKRSVDVDQVVCIRESPSRIPAALANKMYAVGETGQGYCVFTLVLADGRRLPYATGNAVDFPRLPDGVRGSDIIDLLPGVGREVFKHRAQYAEESGVDYWWCLYSTDESTHPASGALTKARTGLVGWIKHWLLGQRAKQD